MRNIDFMPEWYRADRRRRNSHLTRMWLGIIGLAALFLWFTVGRSRVNEAEGHLAHLRSQNRTVQAGLGIIDQLRDEQALLLEKYKLAVQLTPRISCVETLVGLAELIPPQVAVQHLELRSSQEQPRKAKSLASVVAKLSDSKADSGNEEHSKNQELQIGLVGLAPSEMDVAVLVGQLSGRQDFHGVNLEYCNATTIEDREGCTFKLKFVVRDRISELNRNESILGVEADS